MDYILTKIPMKNASKVFDYIRNCTTETESNSNIIESYSVMIRLALLYFKPKGTKLSIKNNVISYQEPHISQGINRYMNNDKSIDITKLYTPIFKVLSRYKSNENNNYIFTMSIDGLNNLKSIYNKKTSDKIGTVTIIDSYITLIESYIKGINITDMKITTDSDENITTMDNIWTDDEISNIVSYLKIINDGSFLSDKYIKYIEDLIYLKETIADEMIKKAMIRF